MGETLRLSNGGERGPNGVPLRHILSGRSKFFEKTKTCRSGVAEHGSLPQFQAQFINKLPVEVIIENTM